MLLLAGHASLVAVAEAEDEDEVRVDVRSVVAEDVVRALELELELVLDWTLELVETLLAGEDVEVATLEMLVEVGAAELVLAEDESALEEMLVD